MYKISFDSSYLEFTGYSCDVMKFLISFSDFNPLNHNVYVVEDLDDLYCNLGTISTEVVDEVWY